MNISGFFFIVVVYAFLQLKEERVLSPMESEQMSFVKRIKLVIVCLLIF